MAQNLNLITEDYLCKILSIPSDNFHHLADQAPKSYHCFSKLKKSGKPRLIEVPNNDLKKIQRDLLDNIFSKLAVDSSLFGGNGSSTKMAVKNHIGKPLLITIDIADFFPSVKSCMVRGMLINRGASKEMTKLLTRFLTYKNHLPHGSPASPCIAKLVLNHAAINIRKALQIIPQSSSSIYVDDITISGPAGIDRITNTIKSIIEREGFKINPDKIKIMSNSKEQKSLGIRLNKRIGPTEDYLKKYDEHRKMLGDSNPSVKGMKGYIAYLTN